MTNLISGRTVLSTVIGGIITAFALAYLRKNTDFLN